MGKRDSAGQSSHHRSVDRRTRTSLEHRTLVVAADIESKEELWCNVSEDLPVVWNCRDKACRRLVCFEKAQAHATEAWGSSRVLRRDWVIYAVHTKWSSHRLHRSLAKEETALRKSMNDTVTGTIYRTGSLPPAQRMYRKACRTTFRLADTPVSISCT